MDLDIQDPHWSLHTLNMPGLIFNDFFNDQHTITFCKKYLQYPEHEIGIISEDNSLEIIEKKAREWCPKNVIRILSAFFI